MGGINHKPTKQLTMIEVSASLSREVTAGFRAALDANMALERAIISAARDGDHEGVTDGLEAAIGHVLRSRRRVGGITRSYDAMLRAMDEVEYRGNERASELGNLALSSRFSGTVILPQVLGEAWNEVEQRLQQDNLPKTFEWERDQFQTLDRPLTDLAAVLETCRDLTESSGPGKFLEAVENNEVPLRQHFARAFSLWSYMFTSFLYSALMTTELFYRSQDLGSLSDPV